MKRESPTALFLRFREAGDLRALADLFDREGPHLFRLARVVASHEAEAEDLFQATFVKAIESAASFDSGRAVEPWLVGILLNEARNARRRSARPIDAGRIVERAGEDPVRAAQERELAAALASALERLPGTYREVLDPHLRQGRSGGEIARELGRSAGVVRMQIHRGLERLRGALKDLEP